MDEKGGESREAVAAAGVEKEEERRRKTMKEGGETKVEGKFVGARDVVGEKGTRRSGGVVIGPCAPLSHRLPSQPQERQTRENKMGNNSKRVIFTLFRLV